MNQDNDRLMEYNRALESEIAALRETERHLTLQYAVSRVLAESISLDEAIPDLLQNISEELGWAAGAFWGIDHRAEQLYCRAIWSKEHLDTEAFEQATWEIRFSSGMGLPGRVWKSGQPEWIINLLEDPNFPRLHKAAQAGLMSGLGFPVKTGKEIHAVIEFFNPDIQPYDAKLLQVVEGIGNQIGLFLQRTKSEEALRSTEGRTRAILETSLDAIISIDHEGKVLEFNPAAERMFGYRRDEVMGQQMAELIVPPWLRESHYRGLDQYLETGEANVLGHRFEITAMRSDGSEFPVELAITRIPSEEPPVFVGYVRDITNRKWAEEALRKSVETQRFLAEASRVLATSLDYETTLKSVAKLSVPTLADWCIVYMKEADGSIRRLAIEHADLTYEHLSEKVMNDFPLDPEAEGGVPGVIRTGESLLFPEVSAATIAQDVRDSEAFRALLAPLNLQSWLCVPLTAHDRILGAISFVTTESGRRYGKEDLELAEDLAHRAALAVDNAKLFGRAQAAIQLRESFLSVASHELKTPLTSILASLELLQRRKQPEEASSDYRLLTLTYRQGKRLQKLINQLLDISRIQSGRLALERSAVDMRALIERLIEEIEPTLRRHTLLFQPPEAPLLVHGDELRLEQVLHNLIDNAIKYSPDGGTVTIRLERQGEMAAVAVSDEGIGIPEDSIDRLFRRFFRAENVDPGQISGMGMGLFIIKEIVSLHGGMVHVTSTEGEGSTFTVTLPLSRKAPEPEERRE